MYNSGGGPPFQTSSGSVGIRASSIQSQPIGHVDALVKTLSDTTQRDELKYKALVEISSNFDDIPNGHVFNQIAENLLRAFLKLFNDTQPQCVSENNTQMIRKLMLEMILRMSFSEAMKSFTKNFEPILIRCITHENEENALLALKILSEHIKQYRLPFVPDVASLMSHFKMMYGDMFRHCEGGNMFLTRRMVLPQWNFEDVMLENTLQQCFCVTSVHVDTSDGTDRQIAYTLIPRAQQSVKVLGEVPSLIILLCNMYKQQVLTDLGDLTQIIASYLSAKIPANIKQEQGFNKEVADEFLNSQIRAFTFLAFYAKASPLGGTASDFFQNNAGQVINSMIALFENCPQEPILPRRELLVAARYFFNSEYQKNFVHMLPRLLNNNTLLGNGVTVNECLRVSVVQMLCDLCHHLRNHLTYDVLGNVVYFFSFMLHTTQIYGHSQAMCCKGLMNLVEAFANLERNHNEPCRDVLMHMFDCFVRKFRFMAKHHVGPLLEKYTFNPRQRKNVEALANTESTSQQESEEVAQSKEKGIASTSVSQESCSSTTGEAGTPMEVDDPANPSICSTEPTTSTSQETITADKRASENSDKTPRLGVPFLPPPSKVGGKQLSIAQLCAMYNFKPPLPTNPQDARAMVRVLMQSIKLIAVGISNSHLTTRPPFSSAREREILSKLFVNGIRCLEVFTISQTQSGPGLFQRVQSRSGVRARDEKEALDYFTNTFTMVNADVFETVFAKNVDFLFEKLLVNNALQFIVNGFLVSPNISVVVGREVLKYLMRRLGDLSEINDRSSMYLKIFKMVFSSVSSSNPSSTLENEKMLKSYLHRTVYESMQFALRAPDPTQYFLLLRSLFRSIGNGTHDLLYQAFLPLLPALLQQMCRIHSGRHRQSVRELFCELCLTVPVRLSSLLPYLPLLMDPLVYAFSGSTSLVQQGLRTLELCVDNLQPEYLYYYMAPVRSPLMQGIWKVIRQSSDVNCTTVALRITGKFGGLNRKMLLEAPHLDYSLIGRDDTSPTVVMKFRRSTEPIRAQQTDEQMDEESRDEEMEDVISQRSREPSESTAFPDLTKSTINCEIDLYESVLTALDHLRTTISGDVASNVGIVLRSATNKQSSLSLRQHSMALCRGVLMMALGTTKLSDLDIRELIKKKAALQMKDRGCSQWRNIRPVRCPNTRAREMYKNALTAVIMSAASRDLYDNVLPFFFLIVRYLSVLLTLESYVDKDGAEISEEQIDRNALDGMILVDALYEVLADAHLEFTKPAVVALGIIHETVVQLCGTKTDSTYQPAVYGYIFDTMINMCYETEWYARHGGCSALLHIITTYPYTLVLNNTIFIVNAVLEVFFGLTDEVSCGTIEMANKTMRALLQRCFTKQGGNANVAYKDLSQTQFCLLADIILRLVEHLHDSIPFVREQVVNVFHEITNVTGYTFSELLNMQKDRVTQNLQNGFRRFMTMSSSCQIGFLEFYSMVHTLNPPVIETNVKDPLTLMFLRNLILLCEADEERLDLVPNYAATATTLEHPYSNAYDRLFNVKMAALKAAVGGYVAVCFAKRKEEGPKYGSEEKYVEEYCKQQKKRVKSPSLSSESSDSSESESNPSTPVPRDEQQQAAPATQQSSSSSRATAVDQEELVKKLHNFVLIDGLPHTTAHERFRVDRKMEVHLQLMQIVLKTAVYGPTKLQDVAYESALNVLKICPEGQSLVYPELQTILKDMAEDPSLDDILIKRIFYLHKLSDKTEVHTYIDMCWKELERFLKRKVVCKLRMEFQGCVWLLDLLCDCHGVHDSTRWLPTVVPMVASSDSELSLPGIEWKEKLRKYMNLYPDQAMAVLMNEVHLLKEHTWRLYVDFLKHPDSLPLREVMVKNEDLFEQILQGNVMIGGRWEKRVENYDKKKYELAVMSVLWAVVKRHPEWFARCERIMKFMRGLWNTQRFYQRYGMRHDPREEKDKDKPLLDYVDETKYRVPKLMVSIMLTYYKNNIDEIGLLFELSVVFSHKFISDFIFFQEYVNDVIIPTFPLYWRRKAFFFVVKKFQQDQKATAADDDVARFMQYIVVPAFAWAFERYAPDEVVGSKPNPDDVDDDNIVSVLVTKIIDVCRVDMTDQMLIAMYQFCILLVQHCPTHIHEISQKLKQIGRLRIFMVFAWPCLQAQGPQDITVKYTGHLLIAHIIDKFAINRKIVLQVHSGLMKAYAQDNRDIIRRALDVITPALPKRMDDGYLQLLLFMKKMIGEESHNIQQMTHCIGTVVRHYKVYYYVRHQMLPFLVTAVQRLMLAHHTVEAKKLIVDVCETIIKWELLRVKLVEKNPTDEMDIDQLLKDTARGANSTERDGCTKARPYSPPVARHLESSTVPTTSSLAAGNNEEVHRPIEKAYADQALNTLIRIACQTGEQIALQNQQNVQVAPATDNLNKRSLMLLKAALKPSVWGMNATLNHSAYEKQLLASDVSSPASQQIVQTQVAVEILSSLTIIIPRTMIVEIVRPLQTALSKCVTSSQAAILRAMYTLLQRLLDRTKCTENGLDEFDKLNDALIQFINESFNKFEKSLPSILQSVVAPLHILRLMCTANEEFLQVTCQTAFVRMIVKLVKDHAESMVPKASVSGGSSIRSAEPKDFLPTETCYCAIDLLVNQIARLSADARRTVSQHVLAPLIEHSVCDKLLAVIIKLTDEFLQLRDDSAITLGIPLLCRMLKYLEDRILGNRQLLQSFLYSVAYVYETPRLRNCDLTGRLEPSFYWGVCCNDEKLRGRFMAVWDEKMSPFFLQRMIYFLGEQDWRPLAQHFWVKHCLHLSMYSLNGVRKGTQDSNAKSKSQRQFNTALRSELTRTCNLHAGLINALIPVGLHPKAEEMVPEENDVGIVLSEDNRDALPQCPSVPLVIVQNDYEVAVCAYMKLRDGNNPALVSDRRKREREIQENIKEIPVGVDRVFEELSYLMNVASRFRFEDMAADFIELCYNDSELACSTWTTIFKTMWTHLEDEERALLTPKILHFMGSGTHAAQKDCEISIMRAFMDAFLSCDPPLKMPRSLISFLACTHNNWHRALLHFEEELCRLGKTSLMNAHLAPADDAVLEQIDILDSLRHIYHRLNESDQSEMIWERRAFFEDTSRLIQLCNLGDFNRAKQETSAVIKKWREKEKNTSKRCFGSYPAQVKQEVFSWSETWVNSLRSLGQWDHAFDFANQSSIYDPAIVAESALQLSEWKILKDNMEYLGASAADEDMAMVATYNAMAHITQAGDYDDRRRAEVETIEKDASMYLIHAWRQLPSIVSHSHMSLLRQAQLLQEVHEGSHIARNLRNIRLERESTDLRERAADISPSATEIKAVVKTWRNRQLSLLDDMPSSTQITAWRTYHFNKIQQECQEREMEEKQIEEKKKAEADGAQEVNAKSNEFSLLGLRKSGPVLSRHSAVNQVLDDMFTLNLNTLASTIFGLAKICRMSNHYLLALDHLKTLQIMPQMMRLDACNKVCEEIKSLSKMAHTKSEVIKSLSEAGVKNTPNEFLIEALEMVKTITYDQFTAEENTRILALKAVLLSRLDEDEDAYNAYVVAGKVYNESNIFTNNSVWKCWGEYLEKLFEKDNKQHSAGLQAMFCFINCARVESRSRKYIAKLLWLMKKMIVTSTPTVLESMDAVMRRCSDCVPSANWVVWLNELITMSKQPGGFVTMRLLGYIARGNPEPFIYMLRKYLSNELVSAQITTISRSMDSRFVHAVDIRRDDEVKVEKEPNFAAVKRWESGMLRLLDMAVRMRPADLISLHEVLHGLEAFSCGWYERQLFRLAQIKKECFTDAFQNQHNIQEANPSPELLQMVEKWSKDSQDISMKTDCERPEEIAELNRQFTDLHDKMKEGKLKLYTVLKSVVSFYELIEKKLKSVLRDGILRRESYFLAKFSTKIAAIDIFGCVMTTKQQQAQYTEKIARFLPTFKVFLQNGKVYRLVSVLSECGKVYTYSLELRKDKNQLAAANEDAVYRMFGLINSFLSRDHECSRRLLVFNQPSVVPVGIHASLIEYAPFGPTYPQPTGNTKLMRYLDIYKDCLQNRKDPRSPDQIILDQYDEIFAMDQSPSPEFILKSYKRIIDGDDSIEAKVPKDLLSKWMMRCYPNATHQWIVRKQTACYLGMYSISEFIFNLTTLGLDFMLLNVFTGQTVATNYAFELLLNPQSTGVNYLRSTKLIPFRLSPNLVQYIGASIDGHMKNAMISLARCLESHDIVTIVRPLLFDIFHGLFIKSQFRERDAARAAEKSGQAIISRLHGASTLSGGQNVVPYMIYESSKEENLAKLDPVLHPWF
uniref:FAT domain-containing protein n=1 Tax=Steinernema glaseri TaxID=37863 RepID=A0A1I7ZRA5_9BILA